MNFADAQQDMRHGYLSGSAGLLTSALVWLVTGLVALNASAGYAAVVLFIGGALIHPLSVILAKAFGRPGAHAPGNPLGALAAASTFLLLFGLLLAYAIFLLRKEWFFPAVLLIVGGRYLIFATVYGMRMYWGCGLLLALAGFLLAFFNAPFPAGAFAGAGIECLFAAVIFSVTRDGNRAGESLA